MKVCNANQQGDFHQVTSLLSWYIKNPACIKAYSAKAPEAASSQAPGGTLMTEQKTEMTLQPWLTSGLY